MKLVRKYKIRQINVREGDRIKAFDGVEIAVLNPEKDKVSQDPNDNSLVLKISSGNTNMLFCGDIKDRVMSRLNIFFASDIIRLFPT